MPISLTDCPNTVELIPNWGLAVQNVLELCAALCNMFQWLAWLRLFFRKRP